MDGKKNNKVSLVVAGFEESPVKQNDSPIGSKKMLATDVKSAFLQGQSIERDIFIKPPTELKKVGIDWKLKTCLWFK